MESTIVLVAVVVVPVLAANVELATMLATPFIHDNATIVCAGGTQPRRASHEDLTQRLKDQ